jgi:hypothetical protein
MTHARPTIKLSRNLLLSLRFASLAVAATALPVACATSEGPSTSEPSPTLPGVDASVTADATTAVDAEASTADASDAAPCEAPCGLAPQCGCKSTETCDLDETGARSCVYAGTAKVGIACLSTRECAAGLVCANGVCRAPCATVGAACTGERAGACREYPKSSTKDGGVSSVTYAACAVTCAYDKEDSCGFTPGDLLAAACVYDPVTNDVECKKVGKDQVQSGLCTSDADCGAGRICRVGPDFSSCRRLCKVGDKNACGGCAPFTPARVVGGATYGFCPP